MQIPQRSFFHSRPSSQFKSADEFLAHCLDREKKKRGEKERNAACCQTSADTTNENLHNICPVQGHVPTQTCFALTFEATANTRKQQKKVWNDLGKPSPDPRNKDLHVKAEKKENMRYNLG